jgi:uncharacterized protein YcgI (DUF1989 family)
VSHGRIIHEEVIGPATGKALPVLKGQVLRVEQIVGEQTLDFNAYNLHDYKEQLSAGRTRSLSGPFPTKGGILWSASPRDKPMFLILEDTVGTNDTMFCRCSAFLREFQYGFDYNTNCHDIYTEAIREYGLTSDDVHDSFNGFMNVGVDAAGKLYTQRNIAKKGDFIDFLALMDCLAVPIACGSDIGPSNNFCLKPLKITVFDKSPETAEIANEHCSRLTGFKNQRSVKDFKVKKIKTSRELVKDPKYKPDFPGVPVKTRKIEVELDNQQYRLLEELKKDGQFGKTDGEILRTAFFRWYVQNVRKGNPHLKT